MRFRSSTENKSEWATTWCLRECNHSLCSGADVIGEGNAMPRCERELISVKSRVDEWTNKRKPYGYHGHNENRYVVAPRLIRWFLAVYLQFGEISGRIEELLIRQKNRKVAARFSLLAKGSVQKKREICFKAKLSWTRRTHTNWEKTEVRPSTTSRPAFLFKIRFLRCCYFRHGRRVERVRSYVHVHSILNNENESDGLKWVCRLGNCSSAWTTQSEEEVVVVYPELLACLRDSSASLRDCRARRRESEAIRRDHGPIMLILLI